MTIGTRQTATVSHSTRRSRWPRVSSGGSGRRRGRAGPVAVARRAFGTGLRVLLGGQPSCPLRGLSRPRWQACPPRCRTHPVMAEPHPAFWTEPANAPRRAPARSPGRTRPSRQGRARRRRAEHFRRRRRDLLVDAVAALVLALILVSLTAGLRIL